MLRMLLGLTLSTVLASAAFAEPSGNAQPPSASKSGVFEFVGYSFMQTDGKIGVQAINEVCQDEFGHGCRGGRSS